MNENNQFLIPANTKRGQLLLGYFYPIDLGIFATGVLISFFMLILFSYMSVGTLVSLLAILPGLIAGALVFPIPNYHNARVALGELIKFYTNENGNKYIWRGWCTEYESRTK